MLTVKLTPRKAPRQPRAKFTVEAILIAAERLSRDPGLDAWTTNHVAELAGVSIGSLYQYFPSKESLVTALYTQRHQARLDALADALVTGDRVGDRVAAALLEGGADERALDRRLRAHLVAASAERKLRPLDEQRARLLTRFLVAHRRWPEPAADRIGTVLAHTLDATLDAIAPAWSADPLFARELAAVVEAMLSPARP